jgi:cyclic-di-GMP-binding protein
MTANDLPFSLSTDSLAAWLDTLASQPPASAANQLNHVLKQLRNDPSEAACLLPLFINLTPPCLFLSNSLSPINLAEANHKLTSKSIKVAKLVTQMLRQLALGFCMLAESGKLDTTQQQLAIYYALQLIGHCLHSYHLLYEIPSSSLWKKSAALYCLAAETHSLEQSQSPKLQEFKAQPTIAAVLKRNILFSIFKPTHYTTPEINQLFQLANQHYGSLDLGAGHDRDFGYYWNLEGDEPCVIKHTHKRLPEGFLAIDCRQLTDSFQQNTFKAKLKPTTQARLELQLSHYEDVFKSMQIGSSSVYQLLTGLPSVCRYFQEQDKLTKIQSLSTGGKPQIRSLGLVPLDKDKDYFESRHIPNKAPLPFKKVNLMRTDSNRFAIIQSRALDCAIGDIALLYKERQPPALAVIRQMTMHDLSGDLHVLLEYIEGSCSIFAFTTTSGASSHALVINGETDDPEVILPPDKYSVDSKLVLKHGITLYLNACLEYNASFVRFKISITDS